LYNLVERLGGLSVAGAGISPGVRSRGSASRTRRCIGVREAAGGRSGELHEAGHDHHRPGDEIRLPRQSERVTGEAELGIVIGREAKNVPVEDAPSVVAGLTTVLDMTAGDILQENPRYLTRAKSFDTFFSFGPELVTLDEAGRSGRWKSPRSSTARSGARTSSPT
jgi:hypothetical protein